MRLVPGQHPLQTVAGGDSLYKYALPFRSDRLLSRLLVAPDGRQTGTLREFPPNHLLFNANSAPAKVWIVSGEARLMFPSGGFVRSTSRLAEPGELIGLSETLGQISYRASLRAVSKCECRIIPREQIVAILMDDQKLRDAMISGLAEGATFAFRAALESSVTRVTYANSSEEL